MAIVDFSVVPVGTGSTSISDAVAIAHKVVLDSAIPHHLNPMSTTIETELGDAFALISQIHQRLRDAGYMRLITKIHIDDRFDREPPRMNAKVQAVKEKVAKL